MLQYFRFDEKAVELNRYEFMKGKKMFFFLARSVFVTVFMMYATLFVAASIPFFKPNNPAILIFG
jgi:hypothetical protein